MNDCIREKIHKFENVKSIKNCLENAFRPNKFRKYIFIFLVDKLVIL